jgi:disulfide bond formation protein DsbB
VQISFFAIFISGVVCAINPKKIVFKIVGYAAAIFGAAFGIKHCCFLWAIQKISETQDYIVHKKTSFEALNCLSDMIKSALKGDSVSHNLYHLAEKSQYGAMAVSNHIFTNIIYIYMAIFTLTLTLLCAAFTCRVSKKYLSF